MYHNAQTVYLNSRAQHWTLYRPAPPRSGASNDIKLNYSSSIPGRGAGGGGRGLSIFSPTFLRWNRCKTDRRHGDASPADDRARARACENAPRECTRCTGGGVLVTGPRSLFSLFGRYAVGWNETWIKYKEWPGLAGSSIRSSPPPGPLTLSIPLSPFRGSRVGGRGGKGVYRGWWFSVLQQSFAGSPGNYECISIPLSHPLYASILQFSPSPAPSPRRCYFRFFFFSSICLSALFFAPWSSCVSFYVA